MRFKGIKCPRERPMILPPFSWVFNRLKGPLSPFKKEAIDGQGWAVGPEVSCPPVPHGRDFIDEYFVS